MLSLLRPLVPCCENRLHELLGHLVGHLIPRVGERALRSWIVLR